MSDESFEIKASENWTDDAWYKNQDDRKLIKNEGWWAINVGEAQGTILGANLCTFNLLHGTEYFPKFTEDTILFVEDDEESKPHHFDRHLQSVIHQPGFENVKGLVVGRFQNASGISKDLLIKIIKSKKELNNLPVIADVDFGHTSPIIAFPVGGKIILEAAGSKIKLEIAKH